MVSLVRLVTIAIGEMVMVVILAVKSNHVCKHPICDATTFQLPVPAELNRPLDLQVYSTCNAIHLFFPFKFIHWNAYQR